MRYYLYHHGILGQRWGKRNGPPYPLGKSDHSKSEKQAGWKKSLDSSSEKSYNSDKESKEKRHLTDGQKRAIKIGATVAATALLAYGTYRLAKSGKLNELADIGKNKIDTLLGNKTAEKEVLAGNADDILKKAEKAAESVKSVDVSDAANEVKNVVASGFKKLAHSESFEETLKNTNPLRGKSEGRNNCTACGINACLRMMGYDVKAKSTGGEMQNLLGIVEECFDGFKKIEGSAIKFGRSRDDAAEMLLKRFGKNAYGVVNVQWRGSGGHTFNWKINNSVVSFFDAQNNWDDAKVSSSFWGLIDPQGAFQAARLDNATIKDAEALKKYVE